MNRTTDDGNTTRSVAWFVVLISASLALGPVATAGWHSGVGAMDGFETAVGTTVDPNGGATGFDEETTAGSAVVGKPAAMRSGKRNGETNGTRGANGSNETRGAEGTGEPKETTALSERNAATNTSVGTDERTAATTAGAGTRETAERTRTTSGIDRGTERDVRDEPNASDVGEITEGPEGRTNNVPLTNDQEGRTHAGLRSGLWIIGVLGVLTTLFSLGGFIAAVMAYRGTD